MKAFQKINRTTPQLKYIWMDLDALFFNTPFFSKEEDKLNRGDNVKKENNNIEKY